MPCTTPASQLGILHGTVDGVPAFRWYDRELGRVLVANRPADAALIEERASTGRGLLADDGVSISNLFTGRRRRAAMTMSRRRAQRGAPADPAGGGVVPRPSRRLRPQLPRTLAEVVKERSGSPAARRARRRPRVHRAGPSRCCGR